MGEETNTAYKEDSSANDEQSYLVQLQEKHAGSEEFTDSDIDYIADTAITSLKVILNMFGETDVSIDEYDGDEGELILNITGGDLAMLIGRHGRVLDALQMIISCLLSSHLNFYYPIIVDIEGYKERRKEKIQSIARSTAARVKKQHRSQSLPSMDAYERRFAHLALADDPEVTTHSEGEDPHRHVVVSLVQ